MEPKGSLLHSQVPATCPYPEPAQTNHTQTPLPEDPSYYYPPIYGWVSQVVSFPQFFHENPVYISPLIHTLYVARPSHSSLFYYPNNSGLGVHIMKLLIT